MTNDGSSEIDQSFTETLVTTATQRVWLPRWLYEALPYLYIIGGIVALVSSVYNRHWSWPLPHIILLGCFLIHGGLSVRRMRQRRRENR